MISLWDITACIYPWIRQNPVSKYFLNKEHQSISSLLAIMPTFTESCVAEIGMGRGNSLKFLPPTSLRLALDKSYRMIKYTKPTYSDIHFIQGSVEHLPLKNSTIDLVLCIGLLEYIENIHGTVKQLYHVIKPKGYLLLTSSPKHIFTYLRFLTGHKIYPRNSEEVEQAIIAHSFTVVKTISTRTQNQYLVRKN